MTNERSWKEVALEPELEIVDSHHHLWTDLSHSMGSYYPTADLLADVTAGHRIVATVFMECRSHYRDDGDELLAPVGETEFIVGQDVPDGIMAGIVGFADLRIGVDVGRVLDAHIAAGGGRFAGVRYNITRDDDPEVPESSRPAPHGILREPDFQRGAAELSDRGLVFESWPYFHQLDELAVFAGAIPDLTIVVDHMGGVPGRGHYVADRPAGLRAWREALPRLAEHENVVVKVGGLGFPAFLSDADRATLTDSAAIADFWQSEVDFCIDTFGADRCMFESNFPVDSPTCDYVTLWNAFKRLSAERSVDERASLFSGTARRVYGLKV